MEQDSEDDESEEGESEEDESEDDESEDDGNDEDYVDINETSEGQGKQRKGKIMAAHSDMEKLLADAQFSMNVIDLVNPLAPLGLGKINTRALVEAEAINLQKAMTTQGIKPFTVENMIPVLIERRHVDPTCIWSGINGYGAPDLKLSEDGVKEVKELELAGGRHRIDAVRKIHDGLRNELAKAEKRTATLTKKKVSKASAVKRKAKDIQAHAAHEEAIRDQLKSVSRWGVVLYDKGEWCIEYRRSD